MVSDFDDAPNEDRNNLKPNISSVQDIFINLINEAAGIIQNKPQPFKRPFVAATIDEQEIKMLYDTGADLSAISENIFRKIPISKRPQQIIERSPRQLRSAGGQLLQVKGKYNFNLQIGKKTISHPFYVIQNLSEAGIMGIDFIHQHSLKYCPEEKSFSWKRSPSWNSGTMKSCSLETIPPLSVVQIKVNLTTETGCSPAADNECMANIAVPDEQMLTGGPALIRPDKSGQAYIRIANCSPTEIIIPRGEFIGLIENVQDCQKRQLNPSYITSIAEKNNAEKVPIPLTKDKKLFIEEKVKLNVPDEYKDRYLNVLFKNHEAISSHKYDLGQTATLMHDVTLRSEEPVYVKQFKIPDAHREQVEQHVTEWLKLGVVQPARSKFNSPIFVVAKKNGGLRLVQDFRALNAQTHTDKYSMKDVSECIGEIGRSGSTIFSTIDLTSGFWQMLLQPKSRPYTAFTISGMGQFQWVTTPMGLLGSPASFQRLMEAVIAGLPNIIVYIDDLLAHSCTHEEHLQQIDALLHRLIGHGIKINLEKCVFGSTNVSYLGFRLTEEGIKPGSDKLKAVAAAKPPANVHEIRQFLGLCNFFRTHVRNFAQISGHLTALTRKDSEWKKGPLPPLALQAFRELQTCLCSEPIVDYPRKDRPYALICDAALGDDTHPGGLGAILTQIDKTGEHCVIAYASRKLQTHEKNYTPFLLEMQAAIWGMDHFSTYLRGRHFTLFSDHKPLEKLGKVHTRTLNRLQEAMNSFDFEIVYKKGSEMPADFLSRNVIDAISWDNLELQTAQDNDPLIKNLKNYLLNRELPSDQKHQTTVRHFANDCFVDNDIVWRRIKRQFEPSRVVVFLPQSFVTDVLHEAHGHLLTGHDGVYKTKERLFQCYYWPGMDADITEHLKTCHKCQAGRIDHRPAPALLTPLPQPTEPNMRIHADLFGSLKDLGRGKRYILTITDAFTKYVELVALPNKEASTVCEAIFNRWICRYSLPLEIVTDQGGEFCNELSAELYKLLQIKHFKTTSRHPACNSQAEVANKTIAKYLRNLVRDDTLDWEQYLWPLMFSYNTSFHRSIKTTPFFLTFGLEPRLPSFPEPDLRRKFYGESSSAELHQRLLYARDVARRNNENSTEENEEYFNRKAEPHHYKIHQLVLLDEHSFLGKNTKLAAKWSGPHRITRIKGPVNVELLTEKGKHLLVHVNRLKPYLMPQKSKVEVQDQLFLESQNNNQFDRPKTIETPQEEIPRTDELPKPLDREPRVDSPLPRLRNEPRPTQNTIPPPAPMPVPAPPAAPVQKKRRGRPPKIKPAQQMDAPEPLPLPHRMHEVQDEFSPEDAQPKPRLIIPQFALRTPDASPAAAPAGGGNESTVVHSLKDQWITVTRKTRKKKQQQNFDPFILQSHDGAYDNELNYDSELESDVEIEEEIEVEEEAEVEEEEVPHEPEARAFTPDNFESEEEEQFETPSAPTPPPRTPAQTRRTNELDQLLFGRLTRSKGPAPEGEELPQRSRRKK